MNWNRVSDWGRQLVDIGYKFVGAGPHHRQRLSDIDTRISVTGVRGKTTAVRWLHEIFYTRGYDTYAKLTGVTPLSLYNGSEHEIERPVRVRLYENEQELRKFDPIDVAVVENQGIREYTTRLVNAQFVRPHVVFLTNIRGDHLETLGHDRVAIARALARAIPPGTHVVSGEQDPQLKGYLEAELERRNATVTHVQLPSKHASLPGAETVYGLNTLLQAVDEPPLEKSVLQTYLARLQVSWTHLPEGRVYNAADANDPQSTELIRRRLVTDTDEIVQPLVYLRNDRRGRTAAFLRYLESLSNRGAIEQARVVGRDADLFARHATFPVVIHDEDAEPPTETLDEALADGWPVMLIGNTVSEFMRELVRVVETNAVDESTNEHQREGLHEDSSRGN